MSNQAKDFITIPGCFVGDDSATGKAVSVTIDGTRHWIPYSQVDKITRDTRYVGNDSITMTKWIAEQKGIEA